MKIFYADDDSDEIFLFHEIIKTIDPSIHCITASNGEEALYMLKQITPDLIFLDVHMPRLDGKECLKAIKQNPTLKTIPVIIYSLDDGVSAVNRYLELGATAFICKKLNLTEIRSRLRSILDSVHTHSKS